MDAALADLQQAGAIVLDIEVPNRARLIAESGLIAHEFERDLDHYLQQFGSTNFSSLEEIVAGGLYHEVVAPLLSRSAASQLDIDRYHAALLAREELRQTLSELLFSDQLDVIAYPPIAALPVATGEAQPGNNCSLSGNSGFPALSLPIGFTASGLPVGIELLGAELSDARLLAIGYAIEQHRPQRRPPASTPPL